MNLAPLPVAVPIVAAVILVIGTPRLPRVANEIITTLGAASSAAFSVTLFVLARHGPLLHWFSGWRPQVGIAIGISFVVDQMGAGIAAISGILATAALVYTWRSFEVEGAHFYVLMMTFLASMSGFALTGDLFNLFVFFELMSVSAYALTGYRIDEPGPLEGALNFGITNSIGGFLILLGIGLVYGRTGALNMAQIGNALSHRPADGLVLVSFALIATGLLVKAAIVPFHFWLADAHAVAPSAVCVLFSGVMVELGIYGIARVFWTMYSDSIAPHAHAFSAIFVALGAVTAVLGSLMAFVQHHLKRLLAYSTIAHAGVFLIGFATLRASGLAGAALYVLGHGAAKGALFLLVGVLLHRLGDVHEEALRGRGRDLVGTGIVFVSAAFVIAELPPFGPFRARSMIDHAATAAGFGWIPWLLILTTALAGGAILRVAARIFLGLGPSERARFPGDTYGDSTEHRETNTDPRRTPWPMIATPAALVGCALIVGLVPGIGTHANAAAARMQDAGGYRAAVLEARPQSAPRALPDHVTGSAFAFGMASVVAATGVAAVSLERRRFPRWLRSRAAAFAHTPVLRLRELHSGVIGDYLAWLVVGFAALGGLLTVFLR